MPWKECHAMDERLRLVARLLEGEKMAPLSQPPTESLAFYSRMRRRLM
jgi:hypothetical protein